MRAFVGELSEQELTSQIVEPWLSGFHSAGHVIEFGLDASSPELALALSQNWERVLRTENFVLASPSPEHERLVGFAAHFPSGLDRQESIEITEYLATAWRIAAAVDPQACVVNQSFDIYGLPHLAPSNDYLEGLRQVLRYFKSLGKVGNLAFPSPDEDDHLIEFEDPETGRAGPPSASTWQSDLSDHSITLIFAADDPFDAAAEISCLASEFGQKWDSGGGVGWAQWSRNVRASGVEIGTEVVRLIGRHDVVECCATSVEAWRAFGLRRATPAFWVRTSSRDFKCLSGFSPSVEEASSTSAEEDAWRLPGRQCYQRLIAAGLDCRRR